MTWLKKVIGKEKAIISMLHLQPMPSDPYYDAKKGMSWVVEKAKKDLDALQEGGVDAIMFSNEYSLPYLTRVKPVTVASMARIIGELRQYISIPYGVNCLWDPVASLDLAAAVDAKFVREIFTGVYASDFGLWNTDCGTAIRHQKEVDAQDVKLLFNIVPEAAQYLTDRDIRQIARSTVFNCRPDAVCVSGLTAGSPLDHSTLKAVKEAIPDTVVFANTGCRKETIEGLLEIADGAVVATTFKVDGKFENPVDIQRVREFMEVVNSCR